MSQLMKAWREGAFEKPPFTFALDDVQGSTYSSYDEFVKSQSFGVSSFEFHLGLIPQPYIGNLAGAKVFLLLLNPGFSPGDYYAQNECSSFQKARLANLRQENGDADYPFFYLNPEFAWTAGGQWWQNKLNSVARKLAKHEKLSVNQNSAYKAALQHISKHLACIELCPYFSKEYKQPKLELQSMKIAREYVQLEVARKCRSSEAGVVITRQVKAWGLESMPNVFRLEGGQTRGAHLTTDAEAEVGVGEGAGDFIYDRLVGLL